MLWCAIAAMLLTSQSRESLATDPIGYIIFAVCNGGTIVVAIVLLTMIAKQTNPEPGYWLAVASLLDGYALSLDISFVGYYGFREMPKLLFILAFTTCAIVLCSWNWYWRIAIGLIGGQLIFTNFPLTLTQMYPFSAFGGQGWSNSLFRMVCTSIEFFAIVFTLLSIGIDIYRKLYRDWLHWGGILYCVMQWAYLIKFCLLPFFHYLGIEFPDWIPNEDPFAFGSECSPFGVN